MVSRLDYFLREVIMSQKALSRWLYAIILLVAVCMAAVYIIIPSASLRPAGEPYADALQSLPHTIFFALTALPVAAALVYAWLIARNIGRDQSFSAANARHLRAISFLAAADGTYYLAGTLIFTLLSGGVPAVPFVQILLALFAYVVSVAAAALSHLVLKAAALQEQSDLTI